MLAEDATWSMPPYPRSYHGTQAIVEFLTTGPMQLEWRHLQTRANGQLAVACYRREPGSKRFAAHVLTLHDARIAAVTSFIDREPFPRFGLPSALRP